MPNVPYVSGNTRITATRMNALWSELDRKMGLLMDGKSWLMLPPDNSAITSILGTRFWFSDVTFGRTSSWGGTDYDHTIFAAAIASATDVGSAPYGLSNPDHTYKLRVMENIAVSLDLSIEAHTISTDNGTGVFEPYWIWQNGNVCPEKKYKYAVAELIYEHAATTSHSIPKEWNKYNYFRIHNLNSYSIDVAFEAPDGSFDVVTVPRYGCQCVQRVAGGMITLGYKYFFKVKKGDPRVLALRTFGGGLPLESMLANNVVNHQLVFQVVTMFSETNEANAGGGIWGEAGYVKWIRDPHVLYDIYDLHADYFGDPAASTTLAGDILHHKGSITYLHKDAAGDLVTTAGRFSGYGAELLNLASSTGLTVVDDASGVTIQGTTGDQWNDVVATGTNLLYAADGTIPSVKDVTAAVSIAFSQPPVSNSRKEGIWPVVKESAAVNHDYEVYTLDADSNAVFDHDESVGYTEDRLDNPNPDITTDLEPWQETIEDVLRFNTFGLNSLIATDQDSDSAELRNRRIKLTAFGPLILWEQAITLDCSIQTAATVRPFQGVDGPHRGAYAYIEGGKIIQHRFLKWPGYGWPEYPVSSGGSYNGAHGGFISPRRTRAVGINTTMQSLTSARAHPNIDMPIWNEDGADFQIRLPTKTESAARTLCSPNLTSPFGGHWPTWQSVDWLYEYETNDYAAIRSAMFNQPPSDSFTVMPRVKLLREHYNTMAAWINSVKKARPFSWRDFVHFLPATSETGAGVPTTHTIWDRSIAVNSVSPGTGSVGIFSTSVRPKEQYAAFPLDHFLYRLFDSLGVTIRTAADFPASWGTLTTTHRDYYELSGTYDHVAKRIDDIGGGDFEVFWREELTSLSTSTTTDTDWKLDGENIAYALDSWPASGGYETDTNPASPTYQQLLLSDYYWVKIEDVKAKAEEMGLKFIFEELSVPCNLEAFDATAIEHIATWSAYSSFVTGTPPSAGEVLSSHTFGVDPVEDSTKDHDVTRWAKNFPYWAGSSASQEWKRDVPSFQTVADIVAGDVSTFIGPVQTTGLFAGRFILKAVLSEEMRKNDRGLRRVIHEYVHKLLYACHVSAGITKANYAISIPTPWLTHAEPNFSELSEVNARSRYAPLDSQNALPIEVAGSYSSAIVTPLTDDYELIEPEEGGAEEVLIWQDAAVDCE